MRDFRSDTVTKPTSNMKKAMMEAILGDDVYQDDPTVNDLESFSAELLGFEAALFVPSGTFSNQLAIMTHSNRGEEIIVEDHAHIKMYEAGAVAGLSGVNMMSLPSVNGEMDLQEIEDSIRGVDVHYPTTRLICIEDAHDGMTLSLNYLSNVKELADKYSIKTHLDGARLFNAAVALDVKPIEITKYFDSVSVCLSKGLCSPIGSILLGTRSFIEKARRNRKMMGGGMRQVGILAACGKLSLTEMVDRLHIDHSNAKYLASLLDEIHCIEVDKTRLDINMVFLKINADTTSLVDEMYKRDILIGGYQGGLRLALHNDVDKEDIDYLVKSLKEVLC